MRINSLTLISSLVVAILSLSPDAQATDYSSQGDLYVADTGLYRISSDGTKSTFAPGNYGYGLTFDLSGNLYATAYVSGSGYSIYKFTLDGSRSTFATGLQQINALTFDLSGNLYAAAYNGDSTWSVFKFSETGAKTTFIQGLSSIGDIEFDRSGNLFVIGGSSIYKYNSEGVQSVFATGIYGDDIAFDAIGNLYANGSSIFKFAPDGTKSIFASLSGVYGIAFDFSGNLYAGQTGSITQITPDGTKTTFAMDVMKPRDMAFAVPEPSTWALLGFGCIGLALASRRFKSRQRLSIYQ